jgi:hypothetical protein
MPESFSEWPSWQLPLVRRMLRHARPFLLALLLFLGLGMAIYHWAIGLSWDRAFLNAAMLVGGMGPIDPIGTPLGRFLVGGYALLAGLGFILLAGIMLTPVVHEALHAFHRERDRHSQDVPPRQGAA